jgi:hypothetical protein
LLVTATLYFTTAGSVWKKKPEINRNPGWQSDEWLHRISIVYRQELDMRAKCTWPWATTVH